VSVNEELLDASIAHQIDLQYYSNGVVNRIMALLNKTDADLFTRLQAALERLPASQFSVERLEAVLGSLRALNAQVYASVSSEINSELRDLVDYEATYQKQLFDNVLPVQVSTQAVTVEQVYAAALARPFQGKLLREWMAGLEADKAIRIRDAIRMGYVEGQTINDIVKRIRGTRALQFKDGVIDITRRNAETIVRTAISHTASFAKDRFYDANASVIKSLKWHSTLDGRTSEPCRARDGKLYTLEHKPIGHSLRWGGGPGNFHFNCRSTSVAVTKSWRELGIDADELSPSTRASMDGQVPDDTTYEMWLRKKTLSFQEDVLGKTKAKLFRDGGLSIDRFSNNQGKSYTLQQLKIRDAEAFKKAGL
jgi:SPP1 gp7 family putative phage head morphogenesis protein